MCRMLWKDNLGQGWGPGRLPRGGDLQAKVHRSQLNKGHWVAEKGPRLIFLDPSSQAGAWPRGDPQVSFLSLSFLTASECIPAPWQGMDHKASGPWGAVARGLPRYSGYGVSWGAGCRSGRGRVMGALLNDPLALSPVSQSRCGRIREDDEDTGALS